MRHGRLLGAIADVAADDPEVRAVYLGLVDRLAAAVAQRLADDPQHRWATPRRSPTR